VIWWLCFGEGSEVVFADMGRDDTVQVDRNGGPAVKVVTLD